MNIKDIGSLVNTQLISEYKPVKISYVYFLTNKEGEIEYVGSTNNLDNRLSSHVTHGLCFDQVFYIEAKLRKDAHDLEQYFISEIKPKKNVLINGQKLRKDYL